MERAAIDGGADSKLNLDLQAEVGQPEHHQIGNSIARAGGGRAEALAQTRADSQIDNEAELRKYVLLSGRDLGVEHQNVQENEQNLANYAVWLEEKKRGLDASILSARSGPKKLVLQEIEEDQIAEQEESDSNIKQRAE